MSNTRRHTAYTFVLATLTFVALSALVVLFVPTNASAKEGGEGRGMRNERFLEFRAHHGNGIRAHFMGQGKHKGWFKHNEEAREWMEDIHESIKDDDYSDFKDTADDTPLGDATTNSIFDDLADASNAHVEGDYEEARDIMKELHEDGYHFKKLIHDSLKKLFWNN